MANRAYLLNTSVPSSDPQFIDARLQQARLDYAEVATASYRIPIAWLCSFRQKDLQSFTWVPERYGDDEQTEAESITTELPVAPLAEAIANLKAALPLFEAITGEQELARIFWQDAVTSLEKLPLPFVSLNPMEVMYSVEPEEYAQLLKQALSGDVQSVPALKELSNYEDGALPYHPDILYNVPGNNHDSARIANTVALDASIGYYFWHSPPGAEQRDRATESAANSPDKIGLRAVSAMVEHALKRTHPYTSINFGFAPNVAGQPQSLKMIVNCKTVVQHKTLMTDAALLDLLFGKVSDQMQEICAGFGFTWAGYVFTSIEGIKHDWPLGLGDWYGMPALLQRPVAAKADKPNGLPNKPIAKPATRPALISKTKIVLLAVFFGLLLLVVIIRPKPKSNVAAPIAAPPMEIPLNANNAPPPALETPRDPNDDKVQASQYEQAIQKDQLKYQESIAKHGGFIVQSNIGQTYEAVFSGQTFTLYLVRSSHNLDLSDATGAISYELYQSHTSPRIALALNNPNQMSATIPDAAFVSGDKVEVRIKNMGHVEEYLHLVVP